MDVKGVLVSAFVEDDWRNPLFSREKCEAWVSMVLRDHAHELAEAIRANKCGDTSPDGMLCACAAAAADLIDPEVT